MSSIQQCQQLRAAAASILTDILPNANGRSELSVADEFKQRLLDQHKLLSVGWYCPPRDGIGMLFGDPNDDYARLNFDSLRSEKYWASDEYTCNDETVGIVYVSPVTPDGIIADWGCTFYRGKNEKIKNHMVNCLQTVEQLAEFPQVGMQYSDISYFAEGLFARQGLVSNFILLTNHKNGTGINCGHSVPWTDKPTTAADKRVFASGDIEAINKQISTARLFVSADEHAVIPQTAAFTAELRLQSASDSSLPNVFIHLIVGFEDGQKTITANFNEFFQAMGMDYIRSKY